jgi:phosphoserine aminotransferase
MEIKPSIPGNDKKSNAACRSHGTYQEKRRLLKNVSHNFFGSLSLWPCVKSNAFALALVRAGTGGHDDHFCIISNIMSRIYNFSAGPATMPVPVLEEVQRNLLELPSAGMSVLEMSHRSATFEAILASAQEGVRKLYGLPDEYHILFLQGGASLQFAMVAMNLLAEGDTADYILSGQWSQKALKEAQKVATACNAQVRVAGSTAYEKFRRIPRQDELALSPGATYVHITTNNTIFGTQWRGAPQTNGVPIVADASSDIFCQPLEIERYGLIYAGAQKNAGPAGVTLVIVRDDLPRATSAHLPTMLDYKTHVKSNSLYNTPNTFGIYVMDLVCKWMLRLGGLEEMRRINREKAAELYAAIDATDFYRGHAETESRSLMNVTFRLPDEDLEKLFVKEATAAGLDGLKGHRDVGGLRASIYNAFPREGVTALVQFMREFERRHG